MKSTWIIIPVHNRRSLTLNCLTNLKSIGAFENFSVIIIDDGSSDGTGDAVMRRFSSTILLQGSGDHYWTGSIEIGMRYAIKRGAECIVWLNDDSMVQLGAIERLAQIANETRGVAGALGYVNMHTLGKKWYFPAQYRSKTGLIFREVLPNSGLVATDACRGNLVAISRHVVEKIGYPDGKGIPHIAGDSDYTLRATKDNIPCSIVTDVLLEELEAVKTDNDSWLLGKIPTSVLWNRMFSKRSSFYPPMRWIYLTRHWGWRGALRFPVPYLKLAVISLIRMIIPRSRLISIYGRRSHAWNATSWSRSSDK